MVETAPGSSQPADWSYLWLYLRTSRLRLFGCTALALLQSVSLLPIAWLVRRIFDRTLPTRDIPELLLLGFGMVVLTAAASGLTLATRFASLRTTKRAITALRCDLVVQCQAMPSAYYDTADRGRLHSLLVQDSLLLDVMVNALICNILPSLVLGVALVATMALLNPRLLGFLSLVMPLMFLLNRRLGARVKVRAARHRLAFSKFSSGVQFMLQRIDLTRYQSAEAFEQRRQHEGIETLRVDSERMAWLQAAYTLAQGSLASLAGIIILVLGGLDVAQGRASIGSLMSFYVATILFSGCLQQLFSAVPHVMEGLQSLGELRRFSSLASETTVSGTRQIDFNGTIELQAVSFGYDSHRLLDEASLLLEPGSTTAIVGPNGGGKTTLARLILGLYHPGQGRILANGVPYDQLDMIELRRAMAFAPQDPIVFAGTIRENLSYGLSEADSGNLGNACRLALVEAFVQQLPQGYDTPVNEEGSVLSGGQRQKLAIARALARKPRLLILDEPTNHLDEDSIRKLLQNLESMPEPPTLLVITQNRSVAEAIPRRFLLQNGRLLPYSPSTLTDGALQFSGLPDGEIA